MVGSSSSPSMKTAALERPASPSNRVPSAEDGDNMAIGTIDSGERRENGFSLLDALVASLILS